MLVFVAISGQDNGWLTWAVAQLSDGSIVTITKSSFNNLVSLCLTNPNSWHESTQVQSVPSSLHGRLRPAPLVPRSCSDPAQIPRSQYCKLTAWWFGRTDANPFLWLFGCCQRILKTRTRLQSQSINDTRLWFPQFYDVKTLRIWEHCFWKLVFLFGILILLLTNLWIDGSDYMSIKGHCKGNIYIYVCMYMCVYVYLVDILNHKKWCYIVILFVEKWIHLERIILGEYDEDRQHTPV